MTMKNVCALMYFVWFQHVCAAYMEPCRHRAFLFKYICDLLLPYLCMLERAKIERGAHVVSSR